MVANLIHDSKDELLIWFLDLDFIKSIVENADSQILYTQIMTKIRLYLGGGKKKGF